MRQSIAISDPSGVAESRRQARYLAESLGFAEERVERVAIVATEAATNLLRHAEGGRILLQRQAAQDGRWMALAAIDDGPGIADLTSALEDGRSAAGSAGNGLGAMRRLSDVFDIHSAPGRGTVAVCEFGSGPRSLAGVEIGVFMQTCPGETACGDAWTARARDGVLDLLVIDGLGHGPRAEQAAQEALTGFAARRESDPAQILSRLSAELAGTRGSVGCLARIEAANGRLAVAGIGNVSAAIARPTGQLRRIISREGRLGGAVRTPPVDQTELQPADTLILHSDGLAALRGIEDFPRLLQRSCAVLAATLMRDQYRGRDDACVAVARIAREQGRGHAAHHA